MDNDRREVEQGRMLGDYRVLHTVGSGGMGIVYAVWDTRLDRRVALKMVHRHLLANPDVTRRFMREARAAARVEHPNVVRVYRVESIDGEPAIEMQYIEGTSLSTLLHSGPLPAGQAADLLQQVLSALSACHAQGIIHCDLKPSNLLLDPDGVIYLTDFGISRALQLSSGEQDGTGLTTGPGWGTPHYAPPEAWNGENPTAAWDIYALGLLVYEALAGHSAFHAHSPAALMNQILNGAPEPIQKIRPELSEDFASLVHDLMARDPASRPANAAAALLRLHQTLEYENYQAETQPLRPRDLLEPSERPTLRLRRMAPLGYVTSFLLMVLILVGIFVQESRDHADAPKSPASPAPVSGAEQAVENTTPGSETDPVLNKEPEPLELTGYNEGAYFTYDDGTHGRELWFVSEDGDAEMVRDLVPGAGSSNPRHLFMAEHDYNLLFSATTPEHGEELWVCRNTAPHKFDAMEIKDIIPGEMGSEPLVFEQMENVFFFYATNLHDGRELWLTTTREAQTAMIEDLYHGSTSSATMNPSFALRPEGLYFLAFRDPDHGQELFFYNYEKMKIQHVSDVFDGAGPMALAGKVLLLANRDDEHGVELWSTQANTQGIGLLKDIEPGPDSSNPDQVFSWHGNVYFSGSTKATGPELWKSDGTPEGTVLLADINPGEAGSSPFAFVPGNDLLFFRATTQAYGNELWCTDGTSDGTRMIIDAFPGPESGKPYNVVAQEKVLLFTANDGTHGEELWCADMRHGGKTTLVADLWPGPKGAEPHNLKATARNCDVFAFRSPDFGPSLGLLNWHDLPYKVKVVRLPKATETDNATP